MNSKVQKGRNNINQNESLEELELYVEAVVAIFEGLKENDEKRESE